MIKKRWQVEHRDIDGVVLGTVDFLFRRSARAYVKELGGEVSLVELLEWHEFLQSPGVTGHVPPTHTTEIVRIGES